ncbi:MAG: hypothetical protein CMD88_05025 [Gammaproteobacteria bacterium]|nr:hypothetical protein [Gammaproteobacteria bacterium]|tara:strand:- start:18254 stop:19048 length:795 start_codon:yes stop_codon:yes gene_type:complete
MSNKKTFLTKAADSRRSFMKGLATVAAATPIIGSLFKSKDAEAASHGVHTMYLRGTYFESCTCETICPCLLLLDPTKGYCTALLGWNIEKGHVGDVDVSGLNVAMYLHAPENLLKGGFTVALYVDNRASGSQEQALKEAWHGIHGGHLGVVASLTKGEKDGPREYLPTRSASIKYDVKSPHRHLVIQGVGENKMEQLGGAAGRPVVVHDTPLAVAPPFPITVSRASKVTYKDHGIEHSYEGGNGLSSPFVYMDGGAKQTAVEKG